MYGLLVSRQKADLQEYKKTMVIPVDAEQLNKKSSG